MQFCFKNNNIFSNFLSPTSSHLDPLQVERLVVDEDDNSTFSLERVKANKIPLKRLNYFVVDAELIK